MNAFFKRQLADYVEYHRDPWNCAMHVFGIVTLFLAAILPLSLWPFNALGVHTSPLAPIMVLPVLIYWLLLDAALGAAILGAAVVLLSAAAIIVSHASPITVWSITAILIVIGISFQVVGHRVFEQRQPALVDQPNAPAARADVRDGEIVHRAWFSARSGGHYRSSSAAIAARPFTLCRGTSGRAAATFMTRVLVTGGTGFIGQHLVSALAAGGRRVRVLDLRPPICAAPGVEYVSGSVLDSDLVDEALRDVDEVYHLAGLPGMWLPQKSDFHAVNFHGTEVVIAAARKRGDCALPALLDRIHPFPAIAATGATAASPACCRPQEMPGLYTRSKMLAEQFAAQAAASGFPLVIGTPTMPIGPHDHNLTPPTAMLRHFLHGRVQLYLDFIVNLVDVRDVAAGLILAMERGQIGHRYILGGESISLKKILQLMATISGRRYISHSGSRPSRGNGRGHAGIHFRSRDAPSADRYG